MARRHQGCVLVAHIVHRKSDMPIAITVGIGFCSPLVPGQLDLGTALVVAQVDERKIIEIETMHRGQVQDIAVERERRVQVTDADHGVNEFCHRIKYQDS